MLLVIWAWSSSLGRVYETLWAKSDFQLSWPLWIVDQLESYIDVPGLWVDPFGLGASKVFGAPHLRTYKELNHRQILLFLCLPRIL